MDSATHLTHTLKELLQSPVHKLYYIILKLNPYTRVYEEFKISREDINIVYSALA